MEMNLLYNSNFSQKPGLSLLDFEQSDPQFYCRRSEKIISDPVSHYCPPWRSLRKKYLNWPVWGCLVNWVIVVSSCIVGRFWVRHGFFNRLMRGHKKLGHRCVQSIVESFCERNCLFYRLLRGCASNWVIFVSSCIVGSFWVRHRFFHWLLPGCVGNWVKAVPRNSLPKPIRQTTRTQSHALPARMADSHLLLFYLTTFALTLNNFSSAYQPYHGACKVLQHPRCLLQVNSFAGSSLRRCVQ